MYDTSETYVFEKNLAKVENFNGLENKYSVKLNDYILTDSKISAGTIISNMVIYFYDLNGAIICEPNLQIIINFYANKTELLLSTQGEENASFLEEYFDNNGLCLEVIEIL